jgi:ribosomal protein L37AE/L43A
MIVIDTRLRVSEWEVVVQQSYQCSNCGAQVAFGTRFCGKCGVQLNWPTQQQMQPLPQYQQQIQQPVHMNWFQRHLNWTWVLSFLPAIVVVFIAEFLVAFSDPTVSIDALTAVGKMAGGTVMLIVSGWVIKQKGRSLWWILLSGWFSPLWLSNKKTESKPLNS